MSRAPWPYGKAVESGLVRYLSPSALMTADPGSEGCPRKWWYSYIQGIKSPTTKAQVRGVSLHEEIEKYLRTGDRSLSSLALSGLHMVPDPTPPLGGPPGADLGIELDIAGGDLSKAPVQAAFVPVVGYIDLVHARGSNKGAHAIEDTVDPPNTIEVIDWKTTGDPKWIKSARDLGRSVQLLTYGRWVTKVEPKVEHIRLSHGYFVERGGPSRKVSLRVLPEHIEKHWEHVEGVARTVVDAAREPDPDKVPANTRVCDRFGGCPAKDVCKARMHSALVSFVGQTAADKLLGKEPQGDTMGLLDRVKAGQPAGAATAPVVTTTPTETSVSLGFGSLMGTPAASAPPAGPTPEQIAAEKAKLEAEEAAQRAAAQLRQAADKFAPLLAKLEAYAAANTAMDLGMPTFVGDAAKLYSAVKGAPASESWSGSGKLAGQTVKDLAEAEAGIASLDGAAAAGQIKPPAAPTSAISFGGLLSNETPAPTVTTPPPAVQTVTATTITPPITTGQITTPPVQQTTTTPPPAEDKKPDGKPEKAPKAPKAPKASTGTTINVIVDGVAEIPGATFESIHPILDTMFAELAASGSDLDLRAAGLRGSDGKLVYDKDSSPFAFGRGDGAIAALVRERSIPPGFYYLDTRGNRLLEIAADSLREQCRKTGGIFVWGRR